MRRIYIAGCGRSGTTMMIRLFRTFADTHIHWKESPIGVFRTIRTDKAFLVVKRNSSTWRHIAKLDPDIHLLYMIRHPYDVLTSRHPKVKSAEFYITPERWTNEYDAMLDVARMRSDSGRFIYVRYEDLVSEPDRVQLRIAAFAGQSIVKPFTQQLAFSTDSLRKHERNQSYLRYLAGLPPQTRSRIDAFCEQFDYDATLKHVPRRRSVMPVVTKDLALFERLNEEYRAKPLVPRPRAYAPAKIEETGRRRAAELARRFGLAGKSVLEIGCGRGEALAALAERHGCRCVGVDVRTYPLWPQFAGAAVRLLEVDLSQDPVALAGERFDFVLSLAAWEHIRHPHAMLERAFGLLRPGGEMYMSANLHRGPKASHRYRQVFFPWPHLLFEDAVFEAFYAKHHGSPNRPSWVNRLTAAQYLLYFDLVGFERIAISYRTTPIDEAFYARFADVLERYPRFDLERDFIEAHLRRPAAG
jgi:2-polyprenyl-3-methyl-5-hydroxy-6-metoxy-1,4-benzoquinol methylase